MSIHSGRRGMSCALPTNPQPKRTILVLLTLYLPGYRAGGPIRTIANLVEHLGDEFDFRILTTDRDIGDTKPYQGIISGSWNPVGKAMVYYLSPAEQTLGRFRHFIRETEHDVLYLNSFFDPLFALFPLVLRRLGQIPVNPTVIAPRGQFAPAALALKSWKKRPYLALVRLTSLLQNVTCQASSSFEAEDIRRSLHIHTARIVLAPNLPAPLQADNLPPLRADRSVPFSVVFLSRVSPMKNLDFALRALSLVTSPISFEIYGCVDDAEYWKACQRMMANAPSTLRVRYHGAVPHEKVLETLARHDLFLLPTRGENYGHAIHEALLAGLPTVVSDRTPWRSLDEEAVGSVLPLTDETRIRLPDSAVCGHVSRRLPGAPGAGASLRATAQCSLRYIGGQSSALSGLGMAARDLYAASRPSAQQANGQRVFVARRHPGK